MFELAGTSESSKPRDCNMRKDKKQGAMQRTSHIYDACIKKVDIFLGQLSAI